MLRAAEDGIRYYKVTGVQTCALPISREPRARLPEGGRRVRRALSRRDDADRGQGTAERRARRAREGGHVPGDAAQRRERALPADLQRRRSEERRVGRAGGC